MSANKPKLEKGTGNELVTVTNWKACYDSEENIIALSCTVATYDASATTSGIGLMLNTSPRIVLQRIIWWR